MQNKGSNVHLYEIEVVLREQLFTFDFPKCIDGLNIPALIWPLCKSYKKKKPKVVMVQA